ncbi:hypothetical protein ACWGLF_25910 [Streptomyces puniciscabiei]
MAWEPDGPEGLLTLVALGCGTGVVPRLVLGHSGVHNCAGRICGGRSWRRCGA